MARKMPTRRKINAASNGHKESALLTAEELAEKLRIPISWVYKQSRQKKIPTHRLGRIRFDLTRSWRARKESKQKTGAERVVLSQPLEKDR